MNEHIMKAMDSDYETYIDFLKECVDDRIDGEGIGLQEAAEEVVSEALEQLRADKPVLERFITAANEVFDVPFDDEFSLEQQVLDTVIKEIHEYELYVAKKTGTLPSSNRLKY